VHHLGIKESDPDGENAGDHVQIDSDARSDEHFETSVAGGGVKVLSEISGSFDNFQNDSLDAELVPLSIDGLSEELGEMMRMN
jgi:hypothetical protein